MEGPPQRGACSSRADEQRVREGAITQCCIAAKTACMLHLRSTHCGPADALRRTAFLDVSSLNFGGAKSAAVFFVLDPPPGQVQIVSSAPFGTPSDQVRDVRVRLRAGRPGLPMRNRRYATPGG